MLRVLSAVVLAAIALGAVIASPWSFLGLVVVAGGLLTWEWGSLTRGNGFDGTALIRRCLRHRDRDPHSPRPARSRASDLRRHRRGHLLRRHVQAPRRLGARRSRLCRLSGRGAGLAAQRPELSALTAVLFLLAVAWTTDTASYVGGRLLGGPKLAPRISPKKTWSGFIVGTLTPGLVGYGFAAYLGNTSALASWLL